MARKKKPAQPNDCTSDDRFTERPSDAEIEHVPNAASEFNYDELKSEALSSITFDDAIASIGRSMQFVQTKLEKLHAKTPDDDAVDFSFGFWSHYPLWLEICVDTPARVLGHDAKIHSKLRELEQDCAALHHKCVHCLMEQAEDFGIDNKPLGKTGELCRRLMWGESRQRYYLQPGYMWETWPECLGESFNSLSPDERKTIDEGQATFLQLEIKVRRHREQQPGADVAETKRSDEQEEQDRKIITVLSSKGDEVEIEEVPDPDLSDANIVEFPPWASQFLNQQYVWRGFIMIVAREAFPDLRADLCRSIEDLRRLQRSPKSAELTPLWSPAESEANARIRREFGIDFPYDPTNWRDAVNLRLHLGITAAERFDDDLADRIGRTLKIEMSHRRAEANATKTKLKGADSPSGISEASSDFAGNQKADSLKTRCLVTTLQISEILKPFKVPKRNSMSRFKKDWPAPELKGDGRQSHYYDLDQLGPILKKQFPLVTDSAIENLRKLVLDSAEK